jgi:hypothetical protein
MKSTKTKNEFTIQEEIETLIETLCDTDVLDELSNEDIKYRIYIINEIKSKLKFEKKHIKKYYLNNKL